MRLGWRRTGAACSSAIRRILQHPHAISMTVKVHLLRFVSLSLSGKEAIKMSKKVRHGAMPIVKKAKRAYFSYTILRYWHIFAYWPLKYK